MNKSNKDNFFKTIPLFIKNLKVDQIFFLPSIKKTALFIGVSPSYLRNTLNKNGYFKNKEYYVIKKFM